MPLVRIEPIRRESGRNGYGAMRGTVELLVPDDELVGAGDPAAWRTLEEQDTNGFQIWRREPGAAATRLPLLVDARGPGVPYEICPFRSRASLTRSSTECTGNLGLTTSTNGVRTVIAIGVKSLRGSYGMCLRMVMLSDIMVLDAVIIV